MSTTGEDTPGKWEDAGSNPVRGRQIFRVISLAQNQI